MRLLHEYEISQDLKIAPSGIAFEWTSFGSVAIRMFKRRKADRVQVAYAAKE
jgi:hypothetical protein